MKGMEKRNRPESAQPDSSLSADTKPTQAIWHPLKSHSRSPRPLQTPAAHFKRPYRNCLGKKSWDRPPLSRRGSPDRDQTFSSTYHQTYAHMCPGVVFKRRLEFASGLLLQLQIHKGLISIPAVRQIGFDVSLCFIEAASNRDPAVLTGIRFIRPMSAQPESGLPFRATTPVNPVA